VNCFYRGIPLVTTATGADGLEYDHSRQSSPQEKTPPFFVAETADGFIQNVIALLTRPDIWEDVSKSSLLHATNHFSLTAQAHDLEDAINAAYSVHQSKHSY
jgi:hypothetical protein